MALRRYAPIGVAAVALAFGVLTLVVARRGSLTSFAGTSTIGGTAELGAGWSLVAAGVLFWIRRPSNRFGPLLTATGFAWFLPEWANPAADTAAAFTVGLAGFAACVPLVAHAALAYPAGRVRSRVEIAVLAVAYAGALLPLGLLPAMVFDPKAAGCFECPGNLVGVRNDPDLFEAFNRYGLRLGLVWLAAIGAALVWGVARSWRGAAAVRLPVLVSATAYISLVAWDFQHSLARGFLGTDPFDRRLWRYEALALVGLALAVGWGLLRERQARAAVARLVVELGRVPQTGALRDALVRTLGDSTLQLAYRRARTGAYVDAFGRRVRVAPESGRAVTPLLRGETPVAVLVHDTALLDRPGLLQDVLAAARIAIENEQLQAEVRAHLEELRASRARIVETGDAERRKLERDLHDGAQQRLLALSYDLRLARATTEADGDGVLPTLLASAVEEAQAALGELRELAHGIYPAILAEAGLEPALATLADEAPIPVELGDVTPERYGAAVETAVYLTVKEAIDEAARREATFVSVDVRREEERLIVAVEDDAPARSSPLVHVADRVGALGGVLEAGPGTLRAEIPCA